MKCPNCGVELSVKVEAHKKQEIGPVIIMVMAFLFVLTRIVDSFL